MIRIIKKNGKKVSAYQLGDKCSIIDDLIQQGKIKKITNDSYEIFSQEAVNGKGEIAHCGDYIKIDSSGYPYPNTAIFFEANHKWLGGNEYEQIPIPINAWTVQEPMCEEIEFLTQKKGLVINADDQEHYFNAILWGTKLSAAKDSVIVFYDITKNSFGKIVDVDFNFVCRKEFEKSYLII